MSSRCSYWTGASVPITGERGSFSGPVWRTSGYSSRAARLPPSTLRSTGPAGLAMAIGASRPSRARVSVPLVYTSEMRGASISVLSGKLPEAGRGSAGVEAVDQADGVRHAGLLDQQALEQIDAGVQVLVDVGDDVVDRGALLDDLGHAADHLVEAVGDLACSWTMVRAGRRPAPG